MEKYLVEENWESKVDLTFGISLNGMRFPRICPNYDIFSFSYSSALIDILSCININPAIIICCLRKRKK
jgi:hypothetical protein